MKKIILVALIAFVNSSFCQTNLVPNSSFEEGRYSFSKPTSFSQLQRLKYWKNFETSDWYSENPELLRGSYSETGVSNGYQGNNNQYINAHTGDKFIGFGPCEGAQIKLINCPEDEFIIISFWFSPRTKEDTEINLYLLKSKASNSALDDCENPEIEYHFHDVIKVNSSGANSEHLPGNWYLYQSKPFYVNTGDVEYDWLAIKGENTNEAESTLGSRKYVYVDDISVSTTSKCNHDCVDTQEEVSFYQIEGQPNILTTSIQGKWDMIIYNATEVNLTITSEQNQEFFYHNAYDPNGLKTEGANHYFIRWNGTNLNGNLVQQDAYTFFFKIKNCVSNIQDEITLNYYPDGNEYEIYPPIKNPWFVKDCCTENITFNNLTFDYTFREDVYDFIHAGGDDGPVIIEENADVSFFAGNEIILSPGFHAKGEFLAKISECDFQNKMKSTSQQQEDDNTEVEADGGRLALTEYINSDIVKNKDNLDIINIYPNPNNGKFTIKINKNITEIVELEIMDLTSKSIFKNSEINNQFKIDLSNYHKGIYLLKIRIDQELHVRKIIYN